MKTRSMEQTIGRRLYLMGFVSLVLAVAVCVFVFHQAFTMQAWRALQNESAILAAQYSQDSQVLRAVSVDDLRITLISPDGTVLYESTDADEQVPMEKITISSDGQGSWSNYDADGKLTEMGVSDVDTIYRQIVYEVKNEKMPLAEALTFGTSNVAKALELYPKKGAVQEGSDGDLLLMNGDLTLDAVIAGGAVMMKDGVLVKKGTYEK